MTERKTEPDEAKWFRMAAALGWRLYGWTDGYRATFILADGTTQEISAEAEKAIARLIATHPAKEG